MLDVYTDFAVNEAAVPVIPGEKSVIERFAGADRTFTIEAMMGDGRALQSGTSHNLGQNFAKAFDIQYLDENNTLQYAWTTSWGVSTRFIGAIIMTHGDDQGLILPPRLAPYQTVIVPIYRKDGEKGPVLEATERIRQELVDVGVRVKVDDRDTLSPGFKFNDWELRGVPTRIEIGPKDIAKNSVALARRDIPGRDGKQFVPQEGLVNTVQNLLDEVQNALLERARQFRDDNTYDVDNYDGFKEVTKAGFARVWWAGSDADEQQVQEETKATLRCIPLDQPGGSGTCFLTGKPADKIAIFARAY
jgi:prolyl-tRNA synthetase